MDFSLLSFRNTGRFFKSATSAFLLLYIITFGWYGYQAYQNVPFAPSLQLLVLFYGVFIIVPVFALAGIFVEYLDHKSMSKKVAEFAVQNGLNYSEETSNLGTGTLFVIASKSRGLRELSGTIDGYPYQLFEYKYSTGSGKNSRSHDAMVVRVTLPRQVPHMVIDSLVESDGSGQSVLPIQFDAKQKLELEGDFYKYFHLYAPTNHGVAALSLIAPDVMESLMRHSAFCDIEIIDNQLYFYWPNVAYKPDDFKQIYRTVEEILSEVGKKLSNGDLSGRADANEGGTIGAAVSNTGDRLKRANMSWLWILLFAGIFIAFVATQGKSHLVVIPTFWASLICIPAIRNAVKHKKQKELQSRFQTYKPLDKKA